MTQSDMAGHSDKLAGQIAVVTGGGSGLGRAMAIGLASAGASVAVIGRRMDPLRETVSAIEEMNGTGYATSADLTRSADASRAIDEVERELGPVDTLVNCAGLVRDQGGIPIWDLSDNDWQSGMEGILNPAFYCSRAVAKGNVRTRQRQDHQHLIRPWSARCAGQLHVRLRQGRDHPS